MKAANGQLPKPRPDVRLYLFFGPDEAGAGDLSRRLIAAIGAAERVDLDAATLRKEPGRLADEAASVSLFGDTRVIRAGPLGEESVEAVTLLLDAAHTGAAVVATAAASIKASSKLAKLALDNPRALAVACYAPTDAEAERMAAGMLAEQGLRHAPGLAARLVEASGGDRAVIARETEKLALYLDAAPERPHDATEADLAAIGADLGDSALGQAVDALLAGDAAGLGTTLTRLDEGGTSAIPWLRAMSRQLVALAEMRIELARGASFDQVTARVFPRERKAATAAALRRWTAPMLATAMARLREAERATMASHNAGAVLAEEVAVHLARRVG